MSKKRFCDKFYEDRMRATNWDEENLCDPPTDSDTCIKYLKDGILGEDYYVVMPENGEQTNTVITYNILHEYWRLKPLDNFYFWLGIFFFGALFGIVLTTVLLCLM